VSGRESTPAKRIALTLASFAVAAALIAALVVYSGVNLRETFARLAAMDRLAFLRMSVLMAFYIFLSSEKWRLIDRVLRHREDTPLPRSNAFTLTSLGVALGQVLPVQVSLSVARTLGTRLYGRALRRGTLGTLFEQAFDFVMVCFLALASAGTRVLHGGARTWLALAVPAAALAVLAAGPATAMVRRIGARVTAGRPARWRQFVSEMQGSGLLEARLGRQLMALSALRFVVLVLTARETTVAIHSSLPLWHLAAAMPFVVLSMAVGITPGGLGLNELTYSAALSLFGTPLAATTQWAIANRLLNSAASFVVAIAASVLLLATSAGARRRARAAASGSQ
jgi:hypothetical protein